MNDSPANGVHPELRPALRCTKPFRSDISGDAPRNARHANWCLLQGSDKLYAVITGKLSVMVFRSKTWLDLSGMPPASLWMENWTCSKMMKISGTRSVHSRLGYVFSCWRFSKE